MHWPVRFILPLQTKEKEGQGSEIAKEIGNL